MKRSLASLLVLMSLLVAAPALAASSIKVLVNDQPITSFDIQQRARLMTIAREKGGEKVATEQLINETLQMADAKRRGFVVPEANVERAFAQIASNMKADPKKLSAMLKQAGIEPETLKRRIRVQMTWGQLVQARQRATKKVKPSDVTATLLSEKKGDQPITSKEFRLQQIIFVVPEKSPPAFVAQRRKEAEAFRGRYNGCDGSLQLAKGLRDVVVRDLGRRSGSDLDGKQGDDIKATAVGNATPPFVSSLGVELVGVCAVRDIQGDAEARSEVEMKLTMEQGKEVGKEYLEELRKTAVIKMR
jgi:peptidyl-prolyl cis-trans isomerase SurA